MAKGKGKKVASAGPKKMHGPKRKLFHEYKPMIKALADLGLLDKYSNFDSFTLACNARGKRNVSRSEFNSFILLSKAEKDLYFRNLKK